MMFLSRETIPKRIYQDIRPYHVTRTPSNGSAVYWPRDIDGDTRQ